MSKPDDADLRAAFDGAVAECLAEGLSQRAIADALGTTRDHVRRALGRIERERKRAQASAIVRASDAPAPAEDDGPAIGEILSEIELMIQRCTQVSDAQGAGRWARTRQALLTGQRERARAKAEAEAAAQTKSTEDWSRLTPDERAILCALTSKLNGAELDREDSIALARLAPPVVAKSCALCYQNHAAHQWVCPECADLAIRLRSGIPIANDGERVVGALPKASSNESAH